MKPSGYILTGGKSQRFGDSDKALALLNGQTLVERTASLIAEHCASINLVAATKDAYEHLPFPIVSDRFPNLGPLGGIDAALSHAGSDSWAFLCPCDIGYVGKTWLPTLMEAVDDATDAVIFQGERYEPLFTLYHGRITNIVETHIQLNILAPHRLFAEINTCVLPLPDDWPDEPSFNTLESLEAFGNKP